MTVVMRPTGRLLATLALCTLSGCALATSTPSPGATSTTVPSAESSPTAAPSSVTTASPVPTVAPTGAPTTVPTATPLPTATAIGPATPPAVQTWTEPQAVGEDLYEDLRAVVDASGNVHVAADRYGVGLGVEYLTNASGSWTVEQVTQPKVRGKDVVNGIAFVETGALEITFARWSVYQYCGFGCERNRSRFDDHYAILNDGSGWSAPTRLGNPELEAYDPVIVERAGHRFAAYSKNISDFESVVYYATEESGAWVEEEVAPGYSPRLAFDSHGDPRILLKELEGDALLATRSADGWQTEPVPTGGDPNDLSVHALMVDSGDRSVVVFSRYDGEGAGYRSYVVLRDGAGWSGELMFANAQADQVLLGPTDVLQALYSVWETETDDGLWHASLNLATGHGSMTRISESYRFAYDGPSPAQFMALGPDGSPYVIFATPYDDVDALYYTRGPAPAT